MSCKPAQSRRSQTAARGAHNRPAVTSDPPLLPRPTGERDGQPCRRHATAPGGRASPTPDVPAWRTRPTRHATGTPDAACRQPHRHLRHHRASSVAEPIPRLEATQHATQQRQPDAAANTAKGGSAVMTVQARGSSGHVVSQAHVPSGGSKRAPSHGVKTTRPCSVPRTARARTTAAPPTTRPVALTPRRNRRRLWQEKRVTLRLRHNDRIKKGTPRHSISYPFPFFLFLSLATGTGKGGYPEKDPSLGRNQAPSLPTDQRFEGCPPEGFDSRLRSRGLYTHYWSEVRSRPLGRVQRPPQATRAPRPLLIRGSKAGPRRVHSRLRSRGPYTHYWSEV